MSGSTAARAVTPSGVAAKDHTAASARGEADTLRLRRGAEAWLKTKPLVDARTGRAYDRVTYEYKNRAGRGYN